VDTRADLDAVEFRKMFVSAGNRTLAVQLVEQSHPGCTK
jgi:prolyl-tRNA editing enzyme YbaK/EbsC (Cys-tRNA(Pro) deacylase)